MAMVGVLACELQMDNILDKGDKRLMQMGEC
jgi:hypothetical protein